MLIRFADNAASIINLIWRPNSRNNVCDVPSWRRISNHYPTGGKYTRETGLVTVTSGLFPWCILRFELHSNFGGLTIV